ncbi:corticotropin-releasing factor receptor 2-like [Physella acuta]|uniref:corticotropin-releasing factor receptor 2-like n=1 Tax=Physella acuta TaxID=109671 RepID=UPI0027DB5AD0|nr:corticotropin-releasing factor receptor 2-like [Physella acuta]
MSTVNILLLSTEYFAYRICLANGTWLANWTNYSACSEGYSDTYLKDMSEIHLYKILIDVIFITNLISLAFLIITLFIFCYFRSIQCSRISIHKHLVVSFIISFSISVFQVQSNSFSIRDIEWLCRAVVTVAKYSQMANFAWMLVEGIYLHNRLVVTVFPSAAPFKTFYFIGWGLPVLFTGLWAGLMSRDHHEACWQGYAKNKLILIIFIPIIIALAFNCAFLVNIIRVLVVKLRNNNLMESRRIRKAIKATVLLLPLLGVANFLFLAQPVNNDNLTRAFRVLNALLPACQGIFVSVLYCFINSEVQNAIKKKWRRCRTNRAMGKRSRRQSSRTSSYFLSQSEVPATRRQMALSKSYISRERDYHSMSVLNMTPEREAKMSLCGLPQPTLIAAQSRKNKLTPTTSYIENPITQDTDGSEREELGQQFLHTSVAVGCEKVWSRCWFRPPTDHLQTTYRPPTDHLQTTYRPPTDHLQTTYRPPTDHLQTTYRPPTDHLQTIYRPPTDHLQTTYRPPIDHLQTTYRPPTDHLQTTYRPPTDHLQTTYRPPTDHLQTTYKLSTDHLQTTYRPPTDHLQTTYRPPTDHLQTTYKLSTDHLQTTYRLPTCYSND